MLRRLAIAALAAWGAGSAAIAAEALPAAARSTQTAATAEPDASGEAAARVYCSTCHLFPEPALLGKSTWMNHTLPRMAAYLGVARINLDSRPDGALLREAKVYPATPLLSAAEWSALVDYYARSAPEEARAQDRARQPTTTSPLFQAKAWLRSEDAPCTTLVRVDPQPRRVLVGDAQTRTLKEFDPMGDLRRQLGLPSGPVALVRQGPDLLLALIGRILPSDEREGRVIRLVEAQGTWSATTLLERLRRPVHLASIRLARSAEPALALSCFGNELGRLSIFEVTPDGSPRENVIDDLAGSVSAQPYDWDGDGREDLTVLRAQGREELRILLQTPEGGFRTAASLAFPPSYGCSSLTLADFDQDGRPEIVVVNGDLGDYPAEPRGYHGVRIYQWSAQQGLIERFFYPIYGAYGARVADFDMNGHADLAVISFFPDYTRAPREAALLLMGSGSFKFEPQYLPGTELGRWLVMDAGDVDGDSDIDLVLGSFVRGPRTIPLPKELESRWEADRVAVVLLENTLRQGERR